MTRLDNEQLLGTAMHVARWHPFVRMCRRVWCRHRRLSTWHIAGLCAVITGRAQLGGPEEAEQAVGITVWPRVR